MARYEFRCGDCQAVFDADPKLLLCPHCAPLRSDGCALRGVLEVRLLEPPRSWPEAGPTDPEFLVACLPLKDPTHLAPLRVGGTPLVASPRLRRAVGTPHLLLKDETGNPTGSAKDRASLLVAAKAAEYGFEAIATASTGNAATALAGVCAASGQKAVVLVPASAPAAKLTQILTYGATVLPVAGTYDEAFELCVRASLEFGWYNRNTALNPFTLEGKKTLALEVAREMAPDVPDVVVVPTGDGVILGGVAKGFEDLREWGLTTRVPRLIAVQPEGAAALVHAFERGEEDVRPGSPAASIADSLVVDVPRNARGALRRIRSSGGAAVTVSESAIVESIQNLARLTGIFAEPAAAASLAGLQRALELGLVGREERIVLLVTGNGLKDREAAARGVEMPRSIEPTPEALEKRLAEIAKARH